VFNLSFFRSFVRSFVRSLARSFVRSFVRSFFRSFFHSFFLSRIFYFSLIKATRLIRLSRKHMWKLWCLWGNPMWTQSNVYKTSVLKNSFIGILRHQAKDFTTFNFIVYLQGHSQKKIMTEAMSMKKLRLRQCPWLNSFPRYLGC